MKRENTTHFDRKGFSGDIYVSNDEQSGFNCLLVYVHGSHPKKKMIDTTRVYFVIEGSGTFTINDNTEDVKRDDLYIIKPGDEYEYEGNMKLFEFNISPENSFKDEIIQ